MAPVVRARIGGAWVETELAGKARLGGVWVEFGPDDEPPPQPVETESLWPGDVTPGNAGWTEAGTAVTLGTLFRVDADGEIRGGRWLFPTSAPTGGQTVEWVLYDNMTQQVLRRATFGSPTWGAWNTVAVEPLEVSAGRWLVAAVYLSAPSNFAYPFTSGYFTAGRTSGNLHAPASSADPGGVGNGRFAVTDTYPGSTFGQTSYFVDVLFAIPTVSGGSVALVGPDRPVVSGSTVGLDVVATNLGAGETITGYTWSVQSGGGSLTGATTATPTYTAPSGSGVAVVRVSVTTSLSNTGYLDVKVSRAANIVAAENALPGTARSAWDLPVGALGGVATLQGFADGFSCNKDETVSFKIGQSDDAGWTGQVYRLGWYGGTGARLYATLTPSTGQVTASQGQPPPGDVCPVSSLLSADCGNWSTTLTWTPPAWAPSGVYVLRLNRTGGGASHVMFVLRDDARPADLMVMPSDSTWVAYNAFGGLGSDNLYAGNSLYYGTSVNQYHGDSARYVSYNRPMVNRGAADPGRAYGAVQWSTFFTGEYPMLRFLERNGIDAKYYACLDAAGDPAGTMLGNVSAAMMIGHNEYWSDGMRAGWEAAKNAGTSIFSCAGNEVFWRLVGHDDDHGGRPRTWECFKSSIPSRDSTGRDEWTGTWRDPDGAGKGGDAPENTLTGTIFTVNGIDLRAIVVPHDGGYSQTPLWRHTTVAALASGQSWTSPNQILGFEWDTYGPAGVSSAAGDHMADPHADAIYCSDVTYSVGSGVLLTDAGAGYDSAGTATHRLVAHPSSGSGGLTFGTGTINWALGVDNANTYQVGGDNVSATIQQATVNALADMGAEAATLMEGLTAPAPADWWDYDPPPQPTGESISLPTPAGGSDGTDDPVTVGMRFGVTLAGSWVGVRVWVTPTAPGSNPSIVAYNEDAGTRLAVKEYVEPSPRGQYHDILFDTPVPVTSGVTYQAAVHTTGRYGHTTSSALALPLRSPSERIYSEADPAFLCRYRYELSPDVSALTANIGTFFHMAPIIDFS